MKFRKKPVVIEATQWFKNGDHPEDYATVVHGFENGQPREFSPEQRRENDWDGSIVRRYRTPEMDGQQACKHCGDIMHNHGWIETLEGGHIVCPGDWIITGVQGEHYPCKPDIFAATYEPAENMAAQQPITGLTFGTALTALKTGQRVARAGWNGKGMFAYLVPANSYSAQTGAAKAFFGEGGMVPYNAYLALKGADDTVSTWAPSGSDALAEDWQIVE
jgi:hypothetical protein